MVLMETLILSLLTTHKRAFGCTLLWRLDICKLYLTKNCPQFDHFLLFSALCHQGKNSKHKLNVTHTVPQLQWIRPTDDTAMRRSLMFLVSYGSAWHRQQRDDGGSEDEKKRL